MRGMTLCLLLGVSALASEWIKVSTARFDVYTNAGERAALDLVSGFNRVHGSFGVAGRGTPVPFRAVVFRSEREYRPYRPGDTAGAFYQGGPDRDYIVMYAGAQSRRALLHEYIHVLLSHSTRRLPQWVEEGMAEFYSTAEVTGGKLRLGGAIPAHISKLRSGKWLPPETLAAIDSSSEHYRNKDRAQLFYAQSWALIHMLSLSPGWRQGMPGFIEEVASGRPQAAAFREAFGREFRDAWETLEGYVRAQRFPVVELPADADEYAAPSATPVAPLEAALVLAELFLRVGRREEAVRAYEEIARRHPSSPEAAAGLGALALAGRRYEEARRHLARAIDLGSREAATFFEYAMLLRETKADPEVVDAQLRRTIELSPVHAEAHFLLGVRLTEDRPSEAIGHLLQATQLLPRQPGFWHALAMAHRRLGQDEAGQIAARRSLDAAVTSEDKEMAEAAVRLFEDRGRPASRRRRPAVTAPDSWKNRAGTQRAEGTLSRVECLGRQARFHIKTADSTLALFVENPGEVLLGNSTSVTFEFSCGVQKPRPVAVEYDDDGNLTSIEFR